MDETLLNPYFLLVESIVCFAGFAINLWSALKIRRTYNLYLAPYLILFLGACCNFLALLANFSTIVYIGLNGNQSKFWCTNFVAQTSGAYFVGSVMLSIISVLRYQIVLHGSDQAQSWKHLAVVIFFTTISFLYVTGFFLLADFLAASTFPMVEVCTKGQNRNAWKSKIMPAYVLPTFIALLVPAFYDLKTYFYLASVKTEAFTNNVLQERKYLEVPLRATIISTFMTVPFITVGILVKLLAHSREIQVYIVSMIVLSMVCLKFPVISVIVFRTNEINKVEDKKVLREKKLEIELQHARERLDQIRGEGKQSQITTVSEEHQAVSGQSETMTKVEI